MNSAIEFHDSEVSSVRRDGHVARISLEPAYIHQSSGRPGVDAGKGYLQSADLVFSGVESLEEKGQCAGAVSDGLISVDQREFANLISVPCSLSGAVSATLTFVSGGVLTVRATEVSCTLRGEARYVEAYQG